MLKNCFYLQNELPSHGISTLCEIIPTCATKHTALVCLLSSVFVYEQRASMWRSSNGSRMSDSLFKPRTVLSKEI